MSNLTRPAPPDQAQREQALHPGRSILVQAPAGSGKTDLLTRRFLRLLSEVEDPAHVVAITFTKAAAAEMRHRIISELERAAARAIETQRLFAEPSDDEFSMESLGSRALEHSRAHGWDLLRMPAQLRISTIDSFCRELALQQPLLSGLGGGLDIAEDPTELYSRAARYTLAQIGSAELTASTLGPALEALLLWRDNGWQEMERLLVEMLRQRDRWMQEFLLAGDSDWTALRERLERPFARALSAALEELSRLLDQAPGACDEVMQLARFACAQSADGLHRELAELAELPCGPFSGTGELEAAHQAYLCLAEMLLTQDGAFRKAFNVGNGFPPDRKREKERIADLIDRLRGVSGFEAKLAALRCLPPARYTDDDWEIVRACFTLLRHAAAQLKVEFAEAGRVDFTEVAHIAQRVLHGDDDLPSDAALAIADGIRHLLIDEFQDTSRRQHKLIGSLVGAWPDFDGRTLFVVGDPMQSIYFFRDADAELFPRVRIAGLELPDADPFLLDFAPLTSNFRTAPRLVERLNHTFGQIFAADDGSGVGFSAARPARPATVHSAPHFELHLDFVPQIARGAATTADALRRKEDVVERRDAAHAAQTQQIVSLIREHLDRIDAARARGEKYRIAVLGRARAALAPIAAALREAAIPFRAVDMEPLAECLEVRDALALARALLNPQERVAWLGVLRAPWCGLSLADLHALTSADDPETLRRPIPALLAERASLLTEQGRRAVDRLQQALAAVPRLRASQPAASLGTWLEQVWLCLGGADCVDATAHANLDLLWKCLDHLQGGEPDLLGQGLDAALAKLMAQPDPLAGSEHGVQLMTIHKSKGLEFEVVIVPELQAGCGRGQGRLLSWLERGLASPDASGDITEFLVAPLPSKGANSGKAKAWVDRVYRQRESQETRRILYVAATRAREQLHLFARPDYKTESDGTLSLCDPRGSLLATSWPALEAEVRARFDAWKTGTQQADIQAIAAASDNLLQMPSLSRSAILHRLPVDYQSPVAPLAGKVDAAADVRGPDKDQLYQRHQGGLQSRALGTAVHSLLEELAHLRLAHDWPAARSELFKHAPSTAAQLRSAGIASRHATVTAQQAVDIALQASHDANGQWILSPHPESASEARWVGEIDGALHEVRVDRVFRAGGTPLSDGEDCWWIIDYKTAQQDGANSAAALLELRALFAQQLERYAEVLRMLHGPAAAIRAGIYYPRMAAFDWWPL